MTAKMYTFIFIVVLCAQLILCYRIDTNSTYGLMPRCENLRVGPALCGICIR